MASSRIFVRGLPPSISEADFKKHFATTGSITDTKLFAHRRIGYVGYQNAAEAEKAVKYFNKTFIRMSKLAVELARPVADSPGSHRQAWHSVGHHTEHNGKNTRPASESPDLKRKRGAEEEQPADPKLQEFLNVMQRRPDDQNLASTDSTKSAIAVAEELVSEDSDEELQTISKRPKQSSAEDMEEEEPPHTTTTDAPRVSDAQDNGPSGLPSSDADWLRSRTNRLLDLNNSSKRDAAEDTVEAPRPQSHQTEAELFGDSAAKTDDKRPLDHAETNIAVPDPSETDSTESKIRESMRLFLRNLSYKTTEDDLRTAFSVFDSLEEVHIPIDSKSGLSRGLAYIMFSSADDAVNAWRQLDGTTLNGRLLHILPASPKREVILDEFALSKLPLKKQQHIKKRREAAVNSFNWNSLFMNADAVLSSVADRLGVNKAELLDPTSSDAAVKQAHAETHVIQETKAYFRSHGVNLDAFTRKKRGDTAILVKNFPYDTRSEELRSMFEQHGKVKRFLMPPTGTIAIVEFEHAPEARSAFGSLAYRKIRTSVLFLEKAPVDLFTTEEVEISVPDVSKPKQSAADLLEEQKGDSSATSATLFVRNLNFTTTTKCLQEVFQPLDGFLSARVKTKTDPKKPGQVLSMGFGFLEFRSQNQAKAALTAMDGYRLDGHTLQIRASHKGHDAAEQRRQGDLAKKEAAKRAKLVIKNLPFEATKKDIRSLFGAYGQLRSVRLPRKVGAATRGFAFAEFTTPKEAESARDALSNTHLLGRRLVIDYAAEEAEDPEEELEKMQSKTGSQMNKVAVQNLTSVGRKKFTVAEGVGEED